MLFHIINIFWHDKYICLSNHRFLALTNVFVIIASVCFVFGCNLSYICMNLEIYKYVYPAFYLFCPGSRNKAVPGSLAYQAQSGTPWGFNRFDSYTTPRRKVKGVKAVPTRKTILGIIMGWKEVTPFKWHKYCDFHLVLEFRGVQCLGRKVCVTAI